MYLLGSKAKKKFAIACLGRKMVFHTKICEDFERIAMIEFKKKAFSSGQGKAQSEPN